MSEADRNEHLTVEITADGVIVVHGDIDIAGGPVLEAAMIATELPDTNDSVVVDLGDVLFIDSSGLRSLLGASHRARDRGATVTLRSVQPEVARLLELTGTADRFIIEPSAIEPRDD
jgi:anti-anti-sigma factor